MKNLSLLLLSIVCITSYGQELHGKITYEETMQFKFDFGMPEDMIAKLPKSQSSMKELLFNNKKSLYRNAPDQNDDKPMIMSDSHDVEININTGSAEDQIFYDIAKNQMVEKKEFMDRIFLIKDDIEKYAWKIGTERKEILGYQCQKATSTKDSTTYDVWFTPQIPVAIGPATFAGLPGAVLEVKVNDGKRTLLATSIDLKSDLNSEITAPGKGKQVSREEFNKIREEKFKEMNIENGGGGNGMRLIIEKQ